MSATHRDAKPKAAPGSPQRRRPWWRRAETVAVIAVLVVAAVVGIAIQAARSGTQTGSSITQPAHVMTAQYAEMRGSASAPVVVEEYGDYQCPSCRRFALDAESTVDRLVQDGSIRYLYYPFAFLGPESESASNAAICAGDQGRFWQLHSLLFQKQSATENSGFLTDTQLIALGKQAGATGSTFESCVRDQTYMPIVRQLTLEASQRGVTSTPTILVNGAVLVDHSAAGLEAAVKAATPTPSATPAP